MRCRLGWHRWRQTSVLNLAHFPTHALVYYECTRCPAKRTELGHLHP